MHLSIKPTPYLWGLNQAKISRITLVFCVVLLVSTNALSAALTLPQTVDLAIMNDPWLKANELRQRAIDERQISAGSLPDPKMSVQMISLPVDTLDVDQENMTQLQMGISQTFPRGESLPLSQQKLQAQSEVFPFQRIDRMAKITREITLTWLDAVLASEVITLIQKDENLFKQIQDIAQANYASTTKQTSQQDIIRASLELVQLEDRLLQQQQNLDTAVASLQTWLSASIAPHFDNVPEQEFDLSTNIGALDDRLSLPALTSLNTSQALLQQLTSHPAVKVISASHSVAQTQVAIEKQKYRPQWQLNASYGYRQDTPSGAARSDLVSVGVTVDLPLFTSNRQDKDVSASIAEQEAVVTEKRLLIREMAGDVDVALKKLTRLLQRQHLYRGSLIQKAEQQAEAALSAYTNDHGDFSEVVRARIAELNARIGALKIDVAVLKTKVELNYYLAGPRLAYTNYRERYHAKQ